MQVFVLVRGLHQCSYAFGRGVLVDAVAQIEYVAASARRCGRWCAKGLQGTLHFALYGLGRGE